MGRPRQFDRDEALQRAMTLFWQHGYESTSLSQLRQAMGGISAASLYAAFGSKEELFKEAIALYLATVGSPVRATLSDQTLDPVAAITLALRSAVTQQACDLHPHGCMVVLSATNCSVQNQPIQAAMEHERHQTRLAFRDCLRRGITSGALQPQTDIDALSAFFSTILNGISIQARDGMSQEDLGKIVDLALASLSAQA